MAPKVLDLSVERFAEMRGVSSQRVYQLIQSGMPHRKRGKVTRVVPREAIAWMIARARDEALAEKALNEAQERARKLRAEADMKELQLAELRRNLAPISEVTAFLEAFTGGFSSVAAGQLGRFERDMIKVDSPAEARSLRMKIHRSLMEGAQRYADEMAARADAMEFEPPPIEHPGEAEEEAPAKRSRPRRAKPEAGVA